MSKASFDETNYLDWYNQGVTSSEQEQYNKAVKELSRSISLNPDYAEAWCERGWAFFETKKYDPALTDFEKAIAIKNTCSEAYHGRGEVWYAKEEYTKAVADYTKVIELQPYDSLGYNNRGYAWRALKEYDKAIEDFTISIGLDPNSASEYFSRGLVKSDKLKTTAGTKNEFEMVIKDFNEAIILDPGYAEAYCKRGMLWATIEEYNKAIKDLEITLQLEPNNKVAKDWLEDTRKKQQNSQYPESDEERQAIRERAAAFIDEIRHHLSATCKIDKDRFLFGWYVAEWDKEKQMPKVAGVQSWLPEVRPDLAKWGEIKDFNGEMYMGVYTHDDEEFWPSLVGIPIKKDLWRAITQVRSQFRIGEKMINEVKDFAIVNRLLERVVVNIRSGQLDRQLVFGEYKLPTVAEEFEATLKALINTPPMPRKKKN